MLCGERLSQQYENSLVLRDVTISVQPGGVTLLLGKSGSGKSTLLRVLSLVERPSSGTVSVEGQVFPNSELGLGVRQMWPDVTVVFQQFSLWPHLTLGRNILLPAELRGRSLTEAETLCSDLGIKELMDRYPNQVSVGQRQRAALARALLLQPRYLLLDEITSAQDVQHVALILDVLRKAVQSGMGVLVVTHHLGFAKRILTMAHQARVTFLASGTVVESGGPELLVNPTTGPLQDYLTLSRMLA